MSFHLLFFGCRRHDAITIILLCCTQTQHFNKMFAVNRCESLCQTHSYRCFITNLSFVCLHVCLEVIQFALFPIKFARDCKTCSPQRSTPIFRNKHMLNESQFFKNIYTFSVGICNGNEPDFVPNSWQLIFLKISIPFFMWTIKLSTL